MPEPKPIEQRVKEARTLHDLVIPKNFRYGNHCTIANKGNGQHKHYHTHSTSEELYQLLLGSKGMSVKQISEQTGYRLNQVHGALGTLREGGYNVVNIGTKRRGIYVIQ